MRRLLPFAVLALAALGSAQTVHFQLKLPKGKRDRMTMTTVMNMGMAIPNSPQPFNMAMTMSTVSTSSVIKADRTGSTMKMTYDKMKQSMKMNGAEMPEAGAGPANAVRGKSILLMFGPTGKLEHVGGLDAFMSPSSTAAPDSTKGSLKSMFNERIMRDMWSMSFGGVFPNRPVHVGDGWPTSGRFGEPPFVMDMNMKMKLLDVETRKGHRMARVRIGGTGSVDMSGLGGSQMTAKSDRFVLAGVLFFDLDRGWISDENMTADVHFTMTVPAQSGTQTVGMTMKMRMNSVVTPLH